METREFLDQSIALMASEEMRKFWVCIREAAGFHLSSAECEPFLAFHRFVTEPEPQFITAWRADPKKERWYRLLVNGVGNVESSFACVRYHQERVRSIEAAAHACFGGVTTEILKAYFKTPRVRFTWNSTVTGTSREYASVYAMLKEEKLARIYGGMHFRFSSDDGATLGRRTGRWVAKNYFQPVKPKHGKP